MNNNTKDVAFEASPNAFEMQAILQAYIKTVDTRNPADNSVELGMFILEWRDKFDTILSATQQAAPTAQGMEGLRQALETARAGEPELIMKQGGLWPGATGMRTNGSPECVICIPCGASQVRARAALEALKAALTTQQAAPGEARLRSAAINVRSWCIPGMNWTDEIGRNLLADLDAALVAAPDEVALKNITNQQKVTK